MNAEVRVRVAQPGGHNIISTQGVITSSQELLIVDSCWEGNTDLVVFLKESTQDPIEVHMRNAYWDVHGQRLNNLFQESIKA